MTLLDLVRLVSNADRHMLFVIGFHGTYGTLEITTVWRASSLSCSLSHKEHVRNEPIPSRAALSTVCIVRIHWVRKILVIMVGVQRHPHQRYVTSILLWRSSVALFYLFALHCRIGFFPKWWIHKSLGVRGVCTIPLIELLIQRCFPGYLKTEHCSTLLYVQRLCTVMKMAFRWKASLTRAHFAQTLVHYWYQSERLLLGKMNSTQDGFQIDRTSFRRFNLQ